MAHAALNPELAEPLRTHYAARHREIADLPALARALGQTDP
ncbi:MAG: hypothetical protein ACRDTC_12525, partial [Pseudonocardiaceae bacterium]